MQKNFIEQIISKKWMLFIIIGILLGMTLLFFDDTLKKTDKNASGTSIQSEEYLTTLESDLEGIINAINGVSEAKVMITLKSSSEAVFALDSNDKTVKHVIVDNELVPTKENLPEIEGVAVVCKGGNDPVAQKRITELIKALLGLYSTHIYVTE